MTLSRVPPTRDAEISAFSRILQKMETVCEGFLTAVFYDELGETIDYHSYMDPFDTRLTAAHQGVIMQSADGRFRWLELGSVHSVEIITDTTETITLALGDCLYLTVVTAAGGISTLDMHAFYAVVAELKSEAGI